MSHDLVDVGCWPCQRRLRRSAGSQTKTSSRHPITSTNTLPPPPLFVSVQRESSPLLTACWHQAWNHVLPHLSDTRQLFHRSSHSGRSALHLACMPGARCPSHVLEAMVRANPLAVVTEDYHQYGGTPLHFCCGSRLRDNPHMVRLLVETALRVQAQYDPQHLPPPRLSYWSPFYQAAKWAAPPATLWIICQARRQQPWMAPWTGAESYWQAAEIRQTSMEPARDSPLRALWRRQTPRRLSSLYGPPVEELRTIATQLLTLPEDQVWDYLLDKQSDEDTEASSEVQHWLKLLVLLRHQVNEEEATLLYTVVALLATVPALVRLVGLIFADQHMQPSRTDGRLPLHVALARYRCTAPIAGNDEVVQILVQAQPQALFVADPLTGHLPLVQAAEAGASVDVLYTILRSAPAVVPATHYSTAEHHAWRYAPRRPWEYAPDQE